MTQSARKDIALIGCGMVASAYTESFRDLDEAMRLTGVLASTPASAENFVAAHREAFPDARALADLDALIAAAPDAVVLITPPNARMPYVEALALAGIPVLMEKPVERSLQAARAIVETFDAANVPLGIVFQHRVRPSVLKLKEVLAERDTGPLHLVEISVPWWRGQGYYDEPGRGSLARDGGGVLISQAIHTLDLALQFTGPVRAVTAMCTTSGFHRMETEDFVSAGLEFEGGARGSLLASTATYPGRPEEIVLHYARVSVTLRAAELVFDWHDGERETIGAAVATGAGEDPMAFTHDWHRAIIADFLAALDRDTPPAASGFSALPVHALIEAIVRSGAEGRRVEVAGDT